MNKLKFWGRIGGAFAVTFLIISVVINSVTSNNSEGTNLGAWFIFGGIVLLSLFSWGMLNNHRREKTLIILKKWLWIPVVTVLVFVGVNWAVKKFDLSNDTPITTRSVCPPKDTMFTGVATMDRPLRLDSLSTCPLVRTVWGPLGYVSYSVRYPTKGGDTTVVYRKEGGHIEIPFPLKWMEFRPIEADSVVMVIKQRHP